MQLQLAITNGDNFCHQKKKFPLNDTHRILYDNTFRLNLRFLGYLLRLWGPGFMAGNLIAGRLGSLSYIKSERDALLTPCFLSL